ncbi:MAG TPA: hypothetical protein VOA41_04825 [Candidatus Dormibacteraeota bacterium]|nr:hypothetical protein [Candidatus Dormibacteraeota bacterium]
MRRNSAKIAIAYISAALLAQGAIHGVMNQARADEGILKFSFTKEQAKKGYVYVPLSTRYSKELGYGFMAIVADSPTAQTIGTDLSSDTCNGTKPLLFSADVPEGNYDILLKLGNKNSGSTTTVKAEARRLLLERSQIPKGEFVDRKFTVNARYKELKSGGTVRLKPDEEYSFDWDHQLTFEINDTNPCVATLEIKPARRPITVYLAGDSTVTDQSKEPWCSWGQMLPRFFKPGVAIANHAESGESLKSFIGEKRLQKILETIKSGDYLFIQFAHNDQKPGPSHVDPFTTYNENLQLYIAEARKRGPFPYS